MDSTNQSLKPLTVKVNEAGNLEIGGCDMVKLVEKYGTPLYVIDETTLKTVCSDYKKAFKMYPKVNMMFASKALCTMATSKLLFDEGFGFDVVSAGEIYTVYKAGVDMAKVLFNGNNKSFDELTLAIELGVGRISVDNFFELSLLNEIAKSNNKVVDILLRITPGIECHTHEYIQTGHLDSKFGFDLTQIDEAVELILNEYTNLKLHGLHAHIGSQIFETSVYQFIFYSFLMHIGLIYGKSKWTPAHLAWIKSLELTPLQRLTADGYLTTINQLSEQIQTANEQIATLANEDRYKDKVQKLVALKGIRTQTAMTILSEIGDFDRFPR